MEHNNIIGIDIAKHVFSVCLGNASGRVKGRKRLYRSDFLEFISKRPPSLIGMEACSGANHWGREFQKMGHTVKLMPPQYVKPYVKTNKNDANDAEGCFEAVQRPTMRFTEVKTERQQELSQIHRVRDRLVGARTALANELRGFLNEFGVVMPKGRNSLMSHVARALEEQGARIPPLTKEIVNRMEEEFRGIEREIDFYEGKIHEIHKSLPASQLLDTLGGVGELTATAIVAEVSNPKQFKNGRQFSAFLGLPPRQHSTGGKTCLGKMSKRGNSYIRKLLIQGAHAELRYIEKKADRRSLWLKGLLKRQGSVNKTAVALANKNARIIWALLARGGKFDRDYAPKSQVKAA